ncbi:MAG: uracil-DNA glycosylase family protein, partial [Oscillospiraceae bacterium]
YLNRQLSACKPKVVILVGNYALKYFLKKHDGISRLHGSFIDYDGYILFPVYHPAALLRNPKLIEVTREDFLKLLDYLKEEKVII